MPSAQSVSSLLLERRDHLIAQWKDRVAGGLAPPGQGDPEILNSVPQFLGGLAAELGTGGMLDPRVDPNATAHGAQRFHAGFSVGTVAREYGVLLDCIYELIERAEVDCSMDEIRTIGRRISSAIAEAVQEFTKERDAAITRERNQHAAFLAHELRNPIMTARLSLALIRQQGASSPAVERMDRALERVQVLIDQTVVGVRLRTLGAGVDLRVERVNLQALIAELADEVADDASQHGVKLRVPNGEPLELDGDRVLLQSAIGNLVRNALKFTRAGETVTVHVRASEDRAWISVEDRCGGLPESQPEELFLPFTQKGTDRSGYGLGLAIAKHAAEAHHGSIQATNLPGVGCVFSIDLPLRQAHVEAGVSS